MQPAIRDEHRTLVLMAPGWVRTDLGGPDARLGIEESIPGVVGTLDALSGSAGLHYVDYLGRTVRGEHRHGAVGQAWRLMHDLADAHSRHGELAEALGFRLGAGRGKVLLRLRDEAMTLTTSRQPPASTRPTRR